ncbi:uncharacterized protein LOC126278928 [Schistocerca gregaria]|uniref:uncharacterized protein LOC126278928 n=1 Tax=Schistocerca gregaria TaxID=7010 RepID=UPI00211E17A0|nr:uncharacterized protein LOC126278928 [Schistocerca gregaria]
MFTLGASSSELGKPQQHGDQQQTAPRDQLQLSSGTTASHSAAAQPAASSQQRSQPASISGPSQRSGAVPASVQQRFLPAASSQRPAAVPSSSQQRFLPASSSSPRQRPAASQRPTSSVQQPASVQRPTASSVWQQQQQRPHRLASQVASPASSSSSRVGLRPQSPS